ncbi:unnamed protein product [Polarella glacialis]|uniref:Helicase C-terminal domain-containing protein n=1 Tax=Polarella glacialis TaxID=89957 RepID=A0A813K9K3_POLGL|nr:unnamed protein product [Polarella glacialis]
MLERPTTDPGLIEEFLCRGGRKLVFSTYHSASAVQKAAVAAGVRFSLAVFDEAHHCAQEDCMFMTAVAEAFSIDRRLFMTATPRQVGPVIGQGEAEQRQELFAMSDPAKFGEIVYRLKMFEAIKAGSIVPFEIVLCRISGKEFSKEELQEMSIQPEEGRPLKDSWALKLVAIQRAIEGLGLKKVFTFHKFVDHAEKYVSEHVGLPAVGYQGEVFTVSGKTSGAGRHRMFQEFAEAESAVMSSCKCLSEGVDAPEVDGVAFIEARRSAIDIVQSAGRAFRKVAGSQKQKAYIMLPLVVDEGQGEIEITATLQNPEFSYLGEVLAALLDEDADEEVWDYFVSSSRKPVSSGSANPKRASRVSQISTYFGEGGLLSVFDGSTRAIMPAGELRDAIKLSVVKRIVPTFERNLALFRDYKLQFGSDYVPQIDTKAGRRLMSEGWSNSFMSWANNMKLAMMGRRHLSVAKKRRLEDSGFQSSSGKQRAKRVYAKPVRYCQWEPLISEYAAEHPGQLPTEKRHFVTIDGHRHDLGGAIRSRLRNIQAQHRGILDKDNFVELFIRSGWLETSWSEGKSRTTQTRTL